MTKPMSRHPPISSSLLLLTPAEAGERIRASEAHVNRLIEDGDLRAVDIAVPGSSRQKIRVRSDDLDAYIEKRTRNPGSPA